MRVPEGMYSVKTGGWNLLIRDGFPADVLTKMSGSKDFLDHFGPYERVNGSKSARVFRCKVGFYGRPIEVYFKQYLHRSFTDIVKHIFRASRAKRSVYATALLKRHGLNAPSMIAKGNLKIGPVVMDNFTITHAITNAPDVYFYCRMVSGADKRVFAEQLGRTIGRMHAANISHGDLRPGNVLGRWNEDSYEFFFLDNERTRQFRRLPLKLRLKNLVQINMLSSDEASMCDRMRFWKAYLEENPAIESEAMKIIRRVVNRTEERLSKKRK